MQTSNTTGRRVITTPPQSNFQVYAGIALGATLLTCLALLGLQYKRDCIAKGGEIEKCWDKGLAIAGMGVGGPLGPGVVFGFIAGSINKEREKQEQFREGYWTFNPSLRSQSATPTADNDQSGPEGI